MKSKINRLLVSVLSICMLASLIPAAYAASDIDGHWAQKAMQSFIDNGYLKGNDIGDYRPDASMSRAEFSAVVNRIKGFTLESSKVSQYSDVAVGSWYYSDIAKALAAGYLEGDGINMNPTGTITRQEAFLIIARVIGLNIENADTSVLNAYSDAHETASWAKNAVAAMISAGLVEGSDGKLNPTGALTRAEGVTVLNRALDTLKSTVVIGDTVYTFSSNSELTGASQIDNTGVYYKVISGEALTGTLYGTADLTFADFYSGDVSSTDGFDAVTSATTSKYAIMSGMYISEVKEDGYQILGVKDVSVSVDAQQYVKAAILKAAGKLDETNLGYVKASEIILNDDMNSAVSQYKQLNADGTYSATKFNVIDTITDATYVLKTGSTWGDYEIDITDGENKYLRNDRLDTWAINSNIQGVIVSGTDSSGRAISVGMEYLQSIWVQPYEISFNVSIDSTQNAHISGWDNIEELSKLVGSTITSVTYIMPEGVYVYEFDGIYIKPEYKGSETITASFSAGSNEVTIAGVPSALENPTVTVTYGSGRNVTTVASSSKIVNGVVNMDSVYDPEQTYTVKIESNNYADIIVDLAMSAAQRASLQELVSQAEEVLKTNSDSGLQEHYEEAKELLANPNATSTEANELINELNGHLSPYVK